MFRRILCPHQRSPKVNCVVGSTAPEEQHDHFYRIAVDAQWRFFRLCRALYEYTNSRAVIFRSLQAPSEITKLNRHISKSLRHLLYTPLSSRLTCRVPLRYPERHLMLRRDLIASDLLDPFLGAIISLAIVDHASRVSTYTSPKATMQTVCQTPSPILGVTPRYRPLSPLLE
jgi:hypothetical protein